MRFQPHEYQSRAIRFILDRPFCALWLDMGLGKTVTTLTALDELIYDRCEVNRVLIIAPKSVALNTWSSERDKWDHLKHLTVSIVMGTPAKRIKALDTPADIYVTNRDNISWLVSRYAKAREPFPFDCVVLDESSSFKNHKSQRYKALRSVRPYIRRLIELTGTPSPNGLEDIWAQVYLLDQGQRLGRYLSHYRDRWFKPGARNGSVVYCWHPRPYAYSEISERLSDITLTMSAADYLLMPQLIDAGMTIMLPEIDEYRRFAKDAVMRLDGEDIVATSAVALTNKLLQFSSGAVYDTEHKWHEVSTAKLDALCDIAESTDEPLLVMFNYRHELCRIMECLPDAIHFCGEPEILERWNRGEIHVMLCHPASVSYGLNLQAGGHIIIWYSLTYNLEQYQQANARLYRQGQTKPVMRYHLVCRGTFDEAVLRALARKDDMQAALIQSIKNLRDEETCVG